MPVKSKGAAARSAAEIGEWIPPENQPPVELTDEQLAAQAKTLSDFYGASLAEAAANRQPNDGFLAKLKEAEARDAGRVRT